MVGNEQNLGMHTPKAKEESCDYTCSVCRSPMSVSKCLAFGPDENGPEAEENAGEDNTGNIHDRSNYSCSVIKTRCGHFFHNQCLLEVKIRKAECPMCRSQLTPVSNPQTVAAAIVTQSLQPSSMRDAIIHASIRARNAVKRSLELQQRREQEEQQAMPVVMSISAQ